MTAPKFTRQQLAQQEARALRLLYAAHGRYPKVAPLDLGDDLRRGDAVCGTTSGYNRHRRLGERCPECLAANNAAKVEQRRRRAAAA
jgi:hypothetical protein